MPIDTSRAYWPCMLLPLYIRVENPTQNEYKVGEKYDVRIEDNDRASRVEGSSGSFNYVHEAVLVAKEEYKLSEIPDLLLALTYNTRSRNEALENVKDIHHNEKVYILIFMRLDQTKEFIKRGYDSILPEEFTKESVEQEGQFTGVGD